MSEPSIPFFRASISDEEITEVTNCLRSGWLTTGPNSRAFEAEFAKALGEGVSTLAVTSATAALHLALDALNIRPGDEVIVPTLTFTATAEVVRYQGAKPVFVDIDPNTLCLSLEATRVAITPRTKAIMAVHFAGRPCDLTALRTLADTNGLKIIDDAAHAFPASHAGKNIGNCLADATAFSFYANKNITTGEGGMVVTNDDELAKQFQMMRLQGISRDAWKRYGRSGYTHWEQQTVGHKCNMSDINASIGIHQLKKIDSFLKIRHKYVAMYDSAFVDVPEIETLACHDKIDHAHHLYIIALRLEQLTVDRDGFLDAMQESGIGVAVHYIALHLQPFYVKNFHTKPQDFPIASSYSERILSIPLYPKMSEADIERVIETVRGLVIKFRR